jgi:hypothetical protein
MAARSCWGAVACARTISTRASIAIISCVRPYPVPPPKPRRWRARPTSPGRERDDPIPTGANQRERDRKHDARAARLIDDPILAHISMLGRPLASRIRRARSSIARARDSGRPYSRRIPAYVEAGSVRFYSA